MLKKLMSMRLMAAGVIMLVAVSFGALSGCSFAIKVATGKKVKQPDGTLKCVEGGRQCIVGEATGSTSVE